MKFQRLFIMFLGIIGCHQTIPHNSIHSMQHGKLKDQLPFEQKKIIDQHFSTFKTTAQAFENGSQGLGNQIGTYAAKLKRDEISGPQALPVSGKITFVDIIEINSGVITNTTKGDSVLVENGTVTINCGTAGSDLGTLNETTGVLVQNTDSPDIAATEITIDGDVEITNQLKLINCQITINGDLTVNGNAAASVGGGDPFNIYFQDDITSTLTVNGDIIFNGSNQRVFSCLGLIEVTLSNTIMIQNCKDLGSMALFKFWNNKIGRWEYNF